MSEDPGIAVAAAVIEDLLHLMPPDTRAAVLAKAAAKEDAERQEREKHGGWQFYSPQTLQAEYEASGRHWNKIMRLKALVAYAFIRTIVNNHSPEDAGRLLFGRHHNGPGSGCLLDYLGKLPQWAKQQTRRTTAHRTTVIP